MKHLQACFFIFGSLLLSATYVQSYPSFHTDPESPNQDAVSMNFGLQLGITAGKSSKAGPKSSKSDYSSKSSNKKKKNKKKRKKKDKKKCTADSCPPNQSCDLDGTCKDDEMLVPCISVIDEDDDYYDAGLDWAAFRSKYPHRSFCLLVPVDIWWGYVDIPIEAIQDPNFRVFNVSREEYNSTNDDDWFELCGLGDLDSSSVRSIGLFVDQSGSMSKYSVENSYNKFIEDAAAANLTVCEVFNWDWNEDWITPFDTSLTPNSGQCTQAEIFVEYKWPTWSPTSSSRPSTSPYPTLNPTLTPPPSTEYPTPAPTATWSRNICLTEPDRYRTCFQRSIDPSNNLTQDIILREEYNKGALNECGEYTPSDNETYMKPYTAPYAAADEELTYGSVYLSLVTAEWLLWTLSCDEQLVLEEVLLEWLNDNVGGPDSFTPVCAFIDDHYIQWLYGDATHKNETQFVTDVLAIKVDFVYASKLAWLNESYSLTAAQTCGKNKQQECCSTDSFNGLSKEERRGIKQSCKEKNCNKCPKNKRRVRRQMSVVGRALTDESLHAENWTDIDLNSILVNYTGLDPIATGAVLDATDLESLAICSASHYNYTEYGGRYYITCEDYENATCHVNDYSYEQGICYDDIPTWSPSTAFPTQPPTVTASPSTSPYPTWSPTTSGTLPSWMFPTNFPTILNTEPTESPTASCYYTGYQDY